MDSNDLMNYMLQHFPNAELTEDNDGQLVIHTNLMDAEGQIVLMDDGQPFEAPTVAPRFYRTVFEVEVLSEGPFQPTDDDNMGDLAAIEYAITEGNCVGDIKEKSSEAIPAGEIRSHLLRLGSDGTFFDRPEDAQPSL